MILVGSANARLGIDGGWRVVARGASALDAVEATVRSVEDDPDDHTVGYSGYPNLLVALLAAGATVDEACKEIIVDMASLDPEYRDIHLHLIVVDAHEDHCAATTKDGVEYVVRTHELSEAATRLRMVAGATE